MAEKVQISVTSLSDIERGNNFPQAKTLCNLALALDVEVWSLFRGEDTSGQKNTLLEHFSEDFSRQINIAIETPFWPSQKNIKPALTDYFGVAGKTYLS